MEQQESNSSQKEYQNSLPQDLLGIIENNITKIVAAVVLIILVFGAIIIIANLTTKAPFKADSKVTINGHNFKTKTARTQAEEEIGLSKTVKMPNDYGMLFPFGKSGIYYFWMKDMKFSIDIIYINQGKVVQIFSKVPIPSDKLNPKIYVSKSEADTVLEINAGLSEKYKIKDGDVVKVTPIK